MKSSCISHPRSESLLVIRQWQIKACDGNVCAAALLSFFEYWHNVKLESSVKARHANSLAPSEGDHIIQDTSLMQFHTAEDIKKGILIYSEDAIRDGVKVLTDKGWITQHKNPNPRYNFDKTRHFVFYPEKVQEWLDEEYWDGNSPIRENPHGSLGNPGLALENPTSHTKTSSKTTTESKDGGFILENKDTKKTSEKTPPNCEIPPSLDTPEFRQAWADWIEYRNKEKKEKLGPVGMSRQLKKMAGWTPARAIAAIDYSITRNWMSIFEEQDSKAGSSASKFPPKPIHPVSQMNALDEAIKTHPANPNGTKFNFKCTDAQRAELKLLRAQRAELSTKIAQAS